MIADTQLLAFALGESDDAEEHVLSCTPCAERVALFLRIGPALAALVRSAGITSPITPSLYAQLDAAGLVTRRYVLPPGGAAPCTVDARDLFSVVRFEANLAGVTRVDLIKAGERMPDVPFDPTHGVVLTATSGALLRTLPTMTLPFQLIAVDERGDRVIAQYTLHHTGFAG